MQVREYETFHWGSFKHMTDQIEQIHVLPEKLGGRSEECSQIDFTLPVYSAFNEDSTHGTGADLCEDQNTPKNVR